MEEKYFSSPEVAKILGITRIAVFKRIKSGSLPAIRVGKNFLIEKEHVFALYQKKLKKAQSENTSTQKIDPAP